MDLNIVDDPYVGIDSEEDRQAIYQKLLERYEQSEYSRRKTIFDGFIDDWRRERLIQEDHDHRSHALVSSFAAGSFGVSFAFISQLVDLSLAVKIPVLIISWALFAFTIVLSLLQLKIGSVVQDKILDNIEKNIEKGYNSEPYVALSKGHIMFPERFLSWFSIVTFIGGLACLLLFILQNI